MKKIRVSFQIILSFILLAASCTSVFAASLPEVVFDGDSETFSYNNVEVVSDTGYPDLFTDIKGAIPGDSFEQVITLTVENVEDETIYIYLRSEGETDDYATLMESVEFTVSYDGQEITGSLTDGVLLGSFKEDASKEITVTFAIPLSVGNEIAAIQGEINWIFVAEIIEDQETVIDPGDDPTVDPGDDPEEDPILEEDDGSIFDILKTGDSNISIVWISLLAISFISIIVVMKHKKRDE